MFRVAAALVMGGLFGCSGALTSPDGGTVTTTDPACTGGSLTISSDIPSCMWAPDHSMVLFNVNDITVSASGGCTAPKLSIVGVTSNQPPVGGGQGEFTPDYTFNSTGVCLRSEREGTSTDRIYSITVQVTDGTVTVDQVINVTVPHDQGEMTCPSVDPSRVVSDGDPRCN